MTNDERCQTMYNYYMTERTFRSNAVLYRVECLLDNDAHFWALRHDEVVCECLIPQELWEQLNSGLALAYAYNCVLDKMEESVL